MKKSPLTTFFKTKKRHPDGENSQDKSSQEISEKEKPISSKLETTIETFKSIYSFPENKDVKIRHIEISGIDQKACLLFISTISDTKLLEEQVIRPLQLNVDPNKKVEDILTAVDVQEKQIIQDLLMDINRGQAALFVDGHSEAYLINVSNFQGRSIDRAENEVVIKGPKEAFNEKAITNISLVRKKIKSESLIVEAVTITTRSKNDVFILYNKDLADKELVGNIKSRLKSIDVDAVQNLSLLEQHIEERGRSLFPTILYTERPDRAASFIEDGYIVLLMDNSPGSLVMPATFWSFFHTSEDHYLRFIYGNFTRGLRFLALFISLFISAIYISVTSFHAEMLPPDLLLAISSTREIVAFPSVLEVFMMEIAFELIREAGLRVPSPIGPTIGIVGALILGQAAVQANVVSPIVVIVVALGGLSSFAIGEINMNFAVRLTRFIFIFSASFFGFFGLTAMLTIGLFYVFSIKSFGVPYFAPFTPKYASAEDTVFRKMMKHEFFRPGYVEPKDIKKAGDAKWRKQGEK
jgi:spore germination protein KA